MEVSAESASCLGIRGVGMFGEFSLQIRGLGLKRLGILQSRRVRLTCRILICQFVEGRYCGVYMY